MTSLTCIYISFYVTCIFTVLLPVQCCTSYFSHMKLYVNSIILFSVQNLLSP